MKESRLDWWGNMVIFLKILFNLSKLNSKNLWSQAIITTPEFLIQIIPQKVFLEPKLL